MPDGNISTIEARTQEQKETWWKNGLKAIAEGKLAVLLLSGGQVCLICLTSVIYVDPQPNDREQLLEFQISIWTN